MKNTKTIALISFTCLLIAGFIILKRITKKQSNKQTTTIGILQTASHPALDAAREGFVTELKKNLDSKVEIIIRNGEGSVANIHTIAEQFHADRNLNGIFAIATPAAQAMATVEDSRPIFIAAVTDPSALGIIHPTTNVCGTKDMIDVKAEVQMLVQLLPNAKTVGLLFNNGEINSVTMVKQMRAELEAHHIIPLEFAVNNEADLPTAADWAFFKTDVVLAPTDNMVASSIGLLASLAQKNKKPLIVSDNMLVKDGALAARGVDYHESGKQAARIALQVLIEGKKPYELPIEQTKSDNIYINKSVLDTLGLTIPETLETKVVIVQ